MALCIDEVLTKHVDAAGQREGAKTVNGREEVSHVRPSPCYTKTQTLSPVMTEMSICYVIVYYYYYYYCYQWWLTITIMRKARISLFEHTNPKF